MEINEMAERIAKAALTAARSKNKPKRSRPMNQRRRMKERLNLGPQKDRGKMPPPSIRHKDKRKKDRRDEKSDLRKEYIGAIDDVRDLIQTNQTNQRKGTMDNQRIAKVSLKEVYDLGKNERKSGNPSTPGANRKFMALLKNGIEKGEISDEMGGSLALMKAFIKGWNDENRKINDKEIKDSGLWKKIKEYKNPTHDEKFGKTLKGTMNQKIASELVDMAERIAHEVVKVSAPKGKTQIALLNYMRDNIGTGLEIGLADIPYRDIPDHLNNIMNAASALSKQGLLAYNQKYGDELTIKLTRKGAS